MSVVNIKGIDKSELLSALYNRSHQQGSGLYHGRGRVQMTPEEASEILESKISGDMTFDYLFGRVMKVDLSCDEMETGLYNRDIGYGAAERVVGMLRTLFQAEPHDESVSDIIEGMASARGGVNR